MITALQIISDTVPAGFCPLSNDDWQKLRKLLHVQLTVDPSINYGNATPTPDSRFKPWIRTNSDNTPDATYVFQNGLWTSRHPLPPDFVGIYAGDPANIPAFDGSQAILTDPITAYSGAFWKQLPNADGRFLVQNGTTPAPFSTVLTAGVQGGEERHSLATGELAPHNHALANIDTLSVATGVNSLGANQLARNNQSGDGNAYVLQGSATAATVGLSGTTGGDGTAANLVVPHNTMPLYLVVTFIQRTGRLFRTQPA